MSQNIYDRPDFFKAYSELIDRSHADLANDLVWSRMSTFVPDVKGLNILDLGCGSGWFCRWATDHGAESVLGLDLSEKMLDKARSLTGETSTGIEYRRADLDDLELPEGHTGKYDLVFSALALHYVVNLATLMALVHRVLKPGGLVVLNVEHPIYTAPQNPHVVTDSDSGEKYWSFNSYHNEGERVIDWLAPGVRKQHRTMTGYIDCFLKAGFDITGFIEWLPTTEEISAGRVSEVDQIRPLFLMMRLKRRL
ncbi:hypothetical protein RBB50_004852 [Rhinocladiella similis]